MYFQNARRYGDRRRFLESKLIIRKGSPSACVPEFSVSGKCKWEEIGNESSWVIQLDESLPAQPSAVAVILQTNGGWCGGLLLYPAAHHRMMNTSAEREKASLKYLIWKKKGGGVCWNCVCREFSSELVSNFLSSCLCVPCSWKLHCVVRLHSFFVPFIFIKEKSTFFP